jgi:triosephosphate isomerase
VREVKKALRNTEVLVGAQNMHWFEAGAWTGEISPEMLKDCGLDLVELGHSERRQYFGETDHTVGLKTAAAMRHGLIPLICVGENIEQRESGRASEVLSNQVKGALQFVESDPLLDQIRFAYEPVWAIGEKGVLAEPAYANLQHSLIKDAACELLGSRPQVLYGGSVTPENSVDLLVQPDIDGLFIGRSAWQAEKYITILQLVSEMLNPEKEHNEMKIAIGADSAGKPLLDVIAAHLNEKSGVTLSDLSEPGYYAELSERVARSILEGENDRGILICGTGIGVSISANKIPGIRAALTHDTYSAERAAKSNNAQIITMGARVIGPEVAKSIVDSWLAFEFDPAGPSAGNVMAIDKLDSAKLATL